MTEYRHEIPMRWADLDSLNHVNNVVYLAYAQNARAVIDGLPQGPIGATTVEFKRPLLLGRRPVVVTTRVEGDQVGPGDTLVVLETMKMEIPVLAPGHGHVSKILVSEGQIVQEGDPVVEIDDTVGA